MDEVHSWLSWWWLVGGPILVAGARAVLRCFRDPATRSTTGGVWTRLVTVSDRELDNERLRQRLKAQDALIEALLHDLARASGIASSPGSQAIPESRPMSSAPTPLSGATSMNTTASESDEE